MGGQGSLLERSMDLDGFLDMELPELQVSLSPGCLEHPVDPSHELLHDNATRRGACLSLRALCCRSLCLWTRSSTTTSPGSSSAHRTSSLWRRMLLHLDKVRLLWRRPPAVASRPCSVADSLYLLDIFERCTVRALSACIWTFRAFLSPCLSTARRKSQAAAHRGGLGLRTAQLSREGRGEVLLQFHSLQEGRLLPRVR